MTMQVVFILYTCMPKSRYYLSMHVKKRRDFGPSIAIVTDILASTVGGLPVRGHTITADMYQSPYLCLKTLMKTCTCQNK